MKLGPAGYETRLGHPRHLAMPDDVLPLVMTIDDEDDAGSGGESSDEEFALAAPAEAEARGYAA